MNSDDRLYNHGPYLPSSQWATPLCIGEPIGPVVFLNHVGDYRSTRYVPSSIDVSASLYHEASPSGMSGQQVVQSAGLRVSPAPDEPISASLPSYEIDMDRLTDSDMRLLVPPLTNYSDETFVPRTPLVYRDRARVNSA
ncbi:hypothetical protein PQX77_014165 [Marasmius sp. AFHP31]|nr:hypothetical protein PQX77_014165 [Marasmius sp. AFHP31]